MINNYNEMRRRSKVFSVVLTFVFASVLFLISLVSAADQGQEIAVIGGGAMIIKKIGEMFKY